MTSKKPLGIFIFSVLLILSSLFWLFAYSNFNTYQSMFGWLSETAVQARYLFSVISRILLLVTGVGILCSKDVFRKLGLAMCVLTICILPWKHPYPLFENLSQNAARQILSTVSSMPPPETLQMIYRISSLYAVGITYAIDIGFALVFILYFTRPKIKNHFRHNIGK